MKALKRVSILAASLLIFLPTAHSFIDYGLSNSGNNSTAQIVLNQASSGALSLLKKVKEYYEENGDLPSAHRLKQCFNASSLIHCFDNDANGGIIVTFSSGANALFANNNPVIRLALAHDTEGNPSFASPLCVTTIGNNALLNAPRNFVLSTTVTGSNFGTCYYASYGDAMNLNYDQLYAFTQTANTTSSSGTSGNGTSGTASITPVF